MKEYKKRIADDLLKRKLSGKGAVLVQGPKWCGKTTTAKQVAGSVLNLGNTSVLDDALETFMSGRPCVFALPRRVAAVYLYEGRHCVGSGKRLL